MGEVTVMLLFVLDVNMLRECDDDGNACGGGRGSFGCGECGA